MEQSLQRETVIDLNHVKIQLGGQTIVQDLHMSIHAGEFIVILGPNGAGKSTLLKLLLGLIKPAEGKVSIFGQSPRRGNQDIGYAPQHRTLEADLALRARDLVGFGLDGHRWGIGLPSRKRTDIINQALAEVDALGFANAPVGQLSGGEQQRLLIAQSLITNPRLLLLDEPLASLDLAHQREIVSVVAKVNRLRRVTVLLVAHDINPLLDVVDRVIYIANRHSAIGTPQEVITSEQLSKLYDAPVEVVNLRDRLFVVGVES